MVQVIHTVTGPLAADQVTQPILIHEHILLDIGQWTGSPLLTVTDEDLMSAELANASAAGIAVVVDQTTRDIGRRPEGLARLSKRSGVAVVACTGFYLDLSYGAANVADRSVESLADEMASEILHEIPGTGIRAGAIGELGTSESGITANETKVLRAAASAQQETGATILTHTALGHDAREQLTILERAGADPSRVVIGHLDGLLDLDVHLEIAGRGALIGYDRIGASHLGSDDDRLQLILEMLDRGYAEQVVLSMDLARSDRLSAYGGHGFSGLTTNFVPRLRAGGVDNATMAQLLIDNPVRLLSLPTNDPRPPHGESAATGGSAPRGGEHIA